GERGGKDAKKIAEDGAAALKGADVLIADSSGRSAFDSGLAAELRALHGAFKPDESFLVVSADMGQAAGRQANEFKSNVPITGVIVTKMDGSGKGGGALSAVAATGAKVAFTGTGEKAEDLEVFDAKKYVGRLLGFPDLETLLSKMQKIVEDESISAEAMLEEKFTLKTFYEQLRATRKMGPLKSVFGMLGMADMPKDLMEQSEEKLKKFEVMINSMTPSEREDARLIKKSASRQQRIARGAGVKVEDVRRLVTEFEKMEKMMGAFKKDRGFRKRIERMVKGGALNMPGAV
ncbi:MAG: signal recognition particle protein Srp19, partial [Candidatus ainarchaeum sp.]|nr:signal recognition particle protein Srp19 [Candidatus ainarchaeum sp.]